MRSFAPFLGVAFLLTLQLVSVSSDLDYLKEWWTIFSTSWTRYERTTQIVQEMEVRFPELVKIYSIGQTVQGREQYVIKLGKNVNEKRALLVTPIKLVANMHGDETLGRALLLMFAVDILDKYVNNNPRAVSLLETTEIHLLYSMNVDGFEAVEEGACSPDESALGRRNANMVDLNRDFPDQYLTPGYSLKTLKENRQNETVNMIEWITSNYFVLSCNLHALSVVASYPFDSVPLEQLKDPGYNGTGVSNPSPDQYVFLALATLYSTNHGFMSKDNDCSKGEFNNGVTNGAEWYNVRGGMQDFNYMHSNTFDITFELSCCKFPAAETLLEEWGNNAESLWKYVEASHWGVMGLVKDEAGHPIAQARIHIEGILKVIETTPSGEYWRMLVPGRYRIWVDAYGYEESETLPIIVRNTKNQLQQDFVLIKKVVDDV